MAHEEFTKEAAGWGSPERLALLVEKTRAGITHDELFNKPSNQPLRDGWQAAAFSLGYQALAGKPIEVRLSSDEGFPDFKIRVDGEVMNFESVMATNKLLGKVYKGDKRTGAIVEAIPRDLPPFDTSAIEAVVAKKKAKHYQGKVHLLTYVNTKGADANHARVSEAVRNVAGDAFESIWLLGYGREVGDTGEPSNFIGCAKATPTLAACNDWTKVPPIKM